MPRAINTGRFDTMQELVDVAYERKFIGGATSAAIAKDEGMSKMSVTRLFANQRPSKGTRERIGLAFEKMTLARSAQRQLAEWHRSGMTFDQMHDLIGINPDKLEGIVVTWETVQNDRQFAKRQQLVQEMNDLTDRREINTLMDMYEATCDQIENEGFESAQDKILLYVNSYKERMDAGADLEMIAHPTDFADYLPDAVQEKFKENLNTLLYKQGE